jgi:DNA repair protein RecN (Recombination protein N)
LLISLHIKNYTLVENLEIEFSKGLTAISGETGAGKSLILEALAVALGSRADAETIRFGEEVSEVTAQFEISDIPPALNWLRERDFEAESTCILRRLLKTEGRSRGYINGDPCTMQQLQDLGGILVDIHNQHEHQSLLHRSTHMRLLDEYAKASTLAARVRKESIALDEANQKLSSLETKINDDSSRIELLQYQISELELLKLENDEIAKLEVEQRKLANAEQIIQDCRRLLLLCSHRERDNIRDNLNEALSISMNLPEKPTELLNVEEMLRSSLIQVEEAAREIEISIDNFSVDPKRLLEVEHRLSAIFQLSRKHKVRPGELLGVFESLKQELAGLNITQEKILHLKDCITKQREKFQKFASQLSEMRSEALGKMAHEINEKLKNLSMKEASFSIELTPFEDLEARSIGLEEVEFVISTSKGQPYRSLNKIASGGELSRISLAIQAVAAQNSHIPTLIFDEVDVGIGGATADTVGMLLKTLGEEGQIISVTHQAQVAAHAGAHYKAKKIVVGNDTISTIEALDPTNRIEELARMLGGAIITDNTLRHASEMIQLARSK